MAQSVHGLTLLLLSCVATSLGSRVRLRQAARQGRRGTYVTRLHRYQHAGRAAMLEAEAHWHAGTTAPSEERFLSMSEPQVAWLERHHAEVALPLASPRMRGTQKSTSLAALHAEQSHPAGGAQSVTLLSDLNSEYVGPIGVGTVSMPKGCKAESLPFLSPADRAGSESNNCHAEEQSEIFVVFDTGSTNLWVNSDLCTEGGCADQGRSRYNHSLSQTFKQPEPRMDLTVKFGTGELDGMIGVDDLHFGPFTVYNQTFGLISEMKGSAFEQIPLEGILGLAFPTMAAEGAQPFFETIIKQKVLPSNEFAFYFSPTNAAANAIFWGGVDETFYHGKIEYFKVTDPFYWSVDLLSFQIGEKEFLGDGKHSNTKGTSFLQEFATPKAIIDTGTTFFTANAGLFGRLQTRLPKVLCDDITDESHPPIVFKLLNTENKVVDFVLPPEQYMTKNGAICHLAFMEVNVAESHGPAMIFGEVFLRYYLSVFDRGNGELNSGRVGFAKSVHGDEVDAHLKKLTRNQKVFSDARPTI